MTDSSNLVTTRVCALDLSVTATGMCDRQGNLHTFSPKARGDARLHEIAVWLTDCVLSLDPHFVAIEDVVVRSSASSVLGMLHGAVRCLLLAEEVPYVVLAPASIKTYATGRGNATKPDMRMEMFKRTGRDVADDNQVDAWWLWALASDLDGEAVIELPQTHRRALAKLTHPLKETT